MLKQLIFIFLLIATSSLPTVLANSSKKAELSVRERQRQVDALLSTQDPVVIRRRIDEVFILVDLLLEEGRREDAMRYTIAGLRHHSWKLRYQMLFAEDAIEKGGKRIATEKAKVVLAYTEKDDLHIRAQQLLGIPPHPPFAEMGVHKEKTPSLILVPIGDVQQCILIDLRERLSTYLNIPVQVRTVVVQIPETRRNPFAMRIQSLRENLLQEMKQDVALSYFLTRQGFGEEDLSEDEEVVNAYMEIARAAVGPAAAADFEANIQRLQKMPGQLNISELLQSLKNAVAPHRKNQVYFIGVCDQDSFSGQSNFIFGAAENNSVHGVVTYHRFTAEFNAENPNQDRLVSRSFKQILSSFGFMLGVERCSTPACARAYPHHLVEHDAKPSKLCTDCQAGFEKALGIQLRPKILPIDPKGK